MSSINKVLKRRELISISFGAIVGWFIKVGNWLNATGDAGTLVAFLIGVSILSRVEFCCKELTAAMPPQYGGDIVFSFRAVGYRRLYNCTWILAIGYCFVASYTACAFSNLVGFLISGFLHGNVHTIAGYELYASRASVGKIGVIAITIVNYLGIVIAAVFHTITTVTIMVGRLFLILCSVIRGNIRKASSPFTTTPFKIMSVALIITLFYLMGVSVIPQIAEDVNIPSEKNGKLLVLSITIAVCFFIEIICSVLLVLVFDNNEIAFVPLAAGDTLKKAWEWSTIDFSFIVAYGFAGIISSWNVFISGGSRVMLSMAKSGMLPVAFVKLNSKYITPYFSILIIGFVTVSASFFRKAVLSWISDAGSLTVAVAVVIVVNSFLILRKREPNMKRPLMAKRGEIIGTVTFP